MRAAIFVLALMAGMAAAAPAQGRPPARSVVVFGSTYADLADFERFAARAKQSGATHINISNDLPWSFWQYDSPGDPYPSWVISNPGLLKIARPEALQPYLPGEWAAGVLGILESRAKVLGKHGLKAAFTTFEPQMLPEAVFAAHPLWRGPRVDHPVRSRVARFAPSVDNPEVLALYRWALATLVGRCPGLEMLSLQTNDSGTGLDWSVGLYDGQSGNTQYRNRPMGERLRRFLGAMQDGAREAGGHLDVDIFSTREPDAAALARTLAPGMGVDNREGPEGTPYKAAVGFQKHAENYFYPVIGIPQPERFLEGLEAAAGSQAPRLVVAMGDDLNRDLYFDIYDRFRQSPVRDIAERYGFMKQLAGARAGALLPAWHEIHEAHRSVELLNVGGTIIYLGCVQQRWTTRPFVPFPSELRADEKDYYRKFQFQARTEEHAADLADLQGNEIFRGWSGHYYANRVLRDADRHVVTALGHLRGLPGREKLVKRLEVLRCLMRTSRNAVSYQAQLDRVRALGTKPEIRPVTGARSGWDRQLIFETARDEIDNTLRLIGLLGSNPRDVLHLAAVPAEEDIRVLGPELVEQLRRKVNIMNAHWRDYDRIFTPPNR